MGRKRKSIQESITKQSLVSKIMEKLSFQDQYELLEYLWLIENPDYSNRPAPDIKTFIDSPYYLNCKDECWDSVKKDLIDFYDSGKHIGIFCEAIGAGKSYKSSIIVAYELHRLLCLKNPQKFLGLAQDSKLAIMNMSVNGEQAKKVIFGEIKARIDNSPWFQKYYKPDENVKSELRFPKNIYVIPGNSQETYPLGYNLVTAIMDESAWFEEGRAEEIFYVLHRRLLSRFGKKWSWKLIVLSSPRYVGDFIEKKIQEREEDSFVIRKSLWEARSDLYKEFVDWEGYKIPKDLYQEAVRNPEKFKRDFMAIPSASLQPYIVNFSAVLDCVDSGLKNKVSLDGEIRFDELLPLKYCWYYIHIDLGLVNNACGLVMCHKENEKIVVDLIYRLQGTYENPVSFAYIREIIYHLREKGFLIKKITYDGWQSIDSQQILQSRGFDVEQLSVDRSLVCYDTLKELFYQKKIVLPFVEKNKIFSPVLPEEWLLKELRELELIKATKVDHPPKGSKDVSDALAGAVYNCIMEEKLTDTKQTLTNENRFSIVGVESVESKNLFTY